MRPIYAVVRRNFPTRSKYPGEKLLIEVLGWDDLLDKTIEGCNIVVSFTDAGISSAHTNVVEGAFSQSIC